MSNAGRVMYSASVAEIAENKFTLFNVIYCDNSLRSLGSSPDIFNSSRFTVVLPETNAAAASLTTSFNRHVSSRNNVLDSPSATRFVQPEVLLITMLIRWSLSSQCS